MLRPGTVLSGRYLLEEQIAEGTPMSTTLQRAGRLGPRQTLEIVTQAAPLLRTENADGRHDTRPAVVKASATKAEPHVEFAPGPSARS